jgi:ferredoxin, 2Fe-2S
MNAPFLTPAARTLETEATSMTFDPELADGAFHVKDREGLNYLLPGLEGFRLMEIMRESGLPIPATCGGACACGTCHVFVEEAWLSHLPPAREEEEQKLDALLYTQGNSRLACQLIWNRDTMDGLRLTLAPLGE